MFVEKFDEDTQADEVPVQLESLSQMWSNYNGNQNGKPTTWRNGRNWSPATIRLRDPLWVNIQLKFGGLIEFLRLVLNTRQLICPTFLNGITWDHRCRNPPYNSSKKSRSAPSNTLWCGSAAETLTELCASETEIRGHHLCILIAEERICL